MNWLKFFELAYTGLIGFEVGFISDLAARVVAVGSREGREGCPLFLLAGGYNKQSRKAGEMPLLCISPAPKNARRLEQE